MRERLDRFLKTPDSFSVLDCLLQSCGYSCPSSSTESLRIGPGYSDVLQRQRFHGSVRFSSPICDPNTIYTQRIWISSSQQIMENGSRFAMALKA